MADHMSAYIELGGLLPEDKVRHLAEQIASQGGPQWGEYYADDEARLEADIRTASSQVRSFVLYDEEAAWGQFDEVESVCRDLDLTYRRHNCAKYEYDASWHWWLPALDEPAYCLSSQDGAALIEADEFRQQLGAASHKALRLTSLDVAIESLVANLEDWLALRKPPDIPPLEIIKDQ